ncbi:hypothetical protein P8891_13440 [Bacillus atrophaeus]|uniref:hypothetical protein n=1 Tax=Bacillus atrophaeus TaxID=1452 RepID=UPI00227DFC61|nr:hypothetical protein [Bacillus atrophaeus]MCY7947333.1 hypothetical protein [Bacillus atrophaeus]MCY9168097.1 hypothetical protein [Bacillus atrophaeus]MEC0742037.1 hypothetical protein [Bacillus atrophaeus]MEC0744649.1 hypothetical protein [Bacillus atrophaeus]MEC0757639.1 hypothetical protein [Bacillus atrophaeus]
MNSDNAISRLHNIIDHVYVKRTEPSYDDTQKSFKEVWSKEFGLESNDLSALLNSLSLLLELVRKSRATIETHPQLNTEKNIGYINNIERGLSQIDLNMGTMKTFYAYINRETVTALYYIGENYSFLNASQSKELESEQVTSLLSEIEELTKNFYASTLPEKLKLIVIKKLNLIREALIQYRITGLDGLQDALEQTIGSIILNGSEFSNQENDQNVKGLFGFINKLGHILSVGNTAGEFIGYIKEYLPLSK